jgi:hypothetical protein
VKRSGRDESIWVVIHKCREAMLRVSLYGYPYLKVAKNSFFLIITYVFSTKLEKRAEQVLPGSKEGREGRGRKQGEGGRDGLNNVCTYE